MRLLSDRIQIWRAPLVDGPYAQRRNWTAAALVADVSGSVQPDTADASRVDRETSPRVGRAYLPPSVDVRTADRLLCAGVWFEVTAAPETWSFGGRAHVRVHVQEVSNVA